MGWIDDQIESYRDTARDQNTRYEEIARVMNSEHSLGFSEENLDILKHSLAAATETLEQGEFKVTAIGYFNEVYAAIKGRDGYNEHRKDIYNNEVGMAVVSWLKENLDRPVTPADIQAVMPHIVRTGLLTDLQPGVGKGEVGVGGSLLAIVQGNMAYPIVHNVVHSVLDQTRGQIGQIIELRDPLCFPAHTPIAISLTETRLISDIRVGDTVLAFDPAADLGRGALVPRKVVRLYRNTTDEWVKLTWSEGGEQKELIATPGHHFLDRFGNFPTIEEMLENGKATVVLASGELTEVTAERITYSAQTAHLFEQAQSVGMVAGNAALKPAAIDAWQTYNFEVEDLHTYVAGGVRVHNKSGFLGRVGNTIDTALDNLLGGNDGDGSLRDKMTDLATAPLHAAGEIVGGFLDGVKAVAKGLGDGFAALARGDIGGAIGAVARGNCTNYAGHH